MKALSIVLMIFSVISIFIPVYGVYLTLIWGFLVIFTFRHIFGLVTIIINIFSLILFSPSLWVIAESADSKAPFIFIGFQIFSLITLLLLKKYKK